MSKLTIQLSYKNACILKHALRDKIKDKEEQASLNETETKELEEEKRALEVMTEEIKQCGFMHNKQVFG